MSTLADRLKEAMDDSPDVKAVDIARACGIKSSSIVDWQSGRTKKIEGSNLLAAAELLRVNPWWLATGRGHKHAPYHLDPAKGFEPGKPSELSQGWPFSSSLAEFELLTDDDKRAIDRVVSQFISASSASSAMELGRAASDAAIEHTTRMRPKHAK